MLIWKPFSTSAIYDNFIYDINHYRWSMKYTSLQQFRDSILEISGNPIGFYEREFYVFSNFASFQVEWRGRKWLTSEHAYQAAHFLETAPALAEQIFYLDRKSVV